MYIHICIYWAQAFGVGLAAFLLWVPPRDGDGGSSSN